jgi:hypothetical protein
VRLTTPCSAEVDNEWNYTSSSPVYFYGLQRNSFTFLKAWQVKLKQSVKIFEMLSQAVVSSILCTACIRVVMLHCTVPSCVLRVCIHIVMLHFTVLSCALRVCIHIVMLHLLSLAAHCVDTFCDVIRFCP